jgi:hypothetical protein
MQRFERVQDAVTMVGLFVLYGRLGFTDFRPWPALACSSWALSLMITGNPALPIIAHFSQNMLTLLLSRLSPLEPIRVGSLVEVGHFIRRYFGTTLVCPTKSSGFVR